MLVLTEQDTEEGFYVLLAAKGKYGFSSSNKQLRYEHLVFILFEISV